MLRRAKKAAYFLMPIERHEIPKCFAMGMMYFFILFNYDMLRSLKDSLLVPNIGAEVIGFVKMYAVTPAALSFMIFYTYLADRIAFEKIFYYVAAFFLVFFLLFGFVFYPHQNFFHPTAETVNALIHSKLNLGFCTFDLDHLKWFFKMYGKWTYVCFYVLAELWGSSMIFLLFWQFANQMSSTDEAKRLYHAYAFIGHIGGLLAGVSIEVLADLKSANLIPLSMLGTSFATVATIAMFIFNRNMFVIKRERMTLFKEEQKYKVQLTLLESLKAILSSKYLGLIVVLVFSYGTCINLIEGVWRSKVLQFYTDTSSYAHFMGETVKYTTASAMFMMLVSGGLLRYSGWLVGALILPVFMVVSGGMFFILAIFEKDLGAYFNYGGVGLLLFTVWFGTGQNILTKAFKYSCFDVTKEMAFIPADHALRSKGKAAVDVVGARWAKSTGAFIQSMLFIVIPAATYTTLAPTLMILYLLVCIIWLFGVKKLYVAYTHKLKGHAAVKPADVAAGVESNDILEE